MHDRLVILVTLVDFWWVSKFLTLRATRRGPIGAWRSADQEQQELGPVGLELTIPRSALRSSQESSQEPSG